MNIYSNKGIKIEKTHPYSSFSNGLAERTIRFVIDGTRAILSGSNLDKKYWPYAVKYMMNHRIN